MSNDPTPEDEAFEELERRIEAKKALDYRQRAVIEAEKFIRDYKDQLGIMTLRKAVEYGYRFGFCDGLREEK